MPEGESQYAYRQATEHLQGAHSQRRVVAMRRKLTFQDRAQIAVRVTQELSDRQIGALLERDRTIIWR